MSKGLASATFFAVFSILALACDKTAESAPPTASVSPEPPPAPTVSAAPVVTATASVPDPEPAAPSQSAAPSKPRPPAPAKVAASAPAAPAPSASVAARPPKMVGGSGASGDGFSLSIQAPTPVQVGQSASAVVVLTAKDPYKCNEKYPYKLVLDAPSGGLGYPAQTLRSMAVAPKQSTMSVPFSVAQAGAATIAGQLSFSICTAEKCLIEKRRVSVTVQAE